jgi:lipid-A-disaccharide synthase-like uncharacterized protein
MAGIVAIEGSYVPQIVRLARLKRAEELSLFFPGLNLVGRLLALTYSIVMRDHVFIAGFLLGAMLRLTLLLQVWWYRRASRQNPVTVNVRGVAPPSTTDGSVAVKVPT